MAMKKFRFRPLVAAALMTCVPYALQADDTDIYIANSSPSGSPPLVMFSLDYRSNLTSSLCNNAAAAGCVPAQYFRTNGLAADVALLGSGKFFFFDLLRLALKLVLAKEEFIGLKVGFMMSHANGSVPNNANSIPNCPTCSNGGAILRGFREIQPADANGALAELNAMIKKLRDLKDGGSAPDHSYQGAEMYFEFFRYLTGQGTYNAHNGRRDFESGNSVNTATNMDAYKPSTVTNAPHTWPDGRIENPAENTYISPFLPGDECTKVYAVNFFFGNSNQDNDSNSAINQSKASGGMGPGTVGNNDAYVRAVEYLKNNDLANGTYGNAPNVTGDQGVTSYFFFDGNAQNTVGQYAEAGGTTARLVSNDPAQVVKELTNLLREILSVSTTFVAASIPVNVFNRAGVVDNVYIALFQPDADAKPYWTGNVKKLKINTDDPNNPFLQDATGTSAIQDSDGRVRTSALTYWTDISDARLASIDNNGTTDDVIDDTPVGKDGRRVPRGGSGQKTPGYITGSPGRTNATAGARQLFHLSEDTLRGDPLPSLDATTAKATELRSALGAADTTEAIGLLRYIRGLQNTGSDTDGPPRAWLMGDPLHSRPLPINYGALALSTGGSYTMQNPGIFIAVGSNDGYLRMIQNTTPGSPGAESGREVWAFMPPEGMSLGSVATQKILQTNTPGSTPKHPYTVDGAPASLVLDLNQDGTIAGSDRVYLYFGLRRGGFSYYALDVTDPLAPEFQWRINNASADFSELGLSYSTPKTGFVQLAGETAPTPVVIFSGGYDGNKDLRTGVGSNDTRGRAIYVVNALTGDLIWKAVNGASTGPVSGDAHAYQHTALVDSIPSDVAIGDTDGDGLIDRIVTGDSGGNIWRADLVGANTANWKLSLLARLGRHADSGKFNDRRFFHEPDLVQTKDAAGAYDAILIESGDREDPLDAGGVTQNWLYMIRDNAVATVASNQTTTHANLADLTAVNCAVAANASSCSGAALSGGWKVQLAGSGEKGLASPLTFNNTVFFTSYVPQSTAGTCAPSEGIGNLYAVSLQNGAPVFEEYDGDSNSLSLGDRKQQLASPGIPAQVVFVPGSSERTILRPDLRFGDAPGSNRFRSFWRRGESPAPDAP